MLHPQLAGPGFAVRNQAEFAQNRLAVAAMMKADYFNVYNLSRRTFLRDTHIAAIGADSLIRNGSALVMFTTGERLCGGRPDKVLLRSTT